MSEVLQYILMINIKYAYNNFKQLDERATTGRSRKPTLLH